MAGSLAIPNTFLGGSPDPISNLDQNFTMIRDYINVREIGFGLLSARPAAGHNGAAWYATDTGALYADNGSAWVQIAAPLSGLISAAGSLVGSGSGADYVTASTPFVDVDAANLKATVAVPVGAKFLIASATFSYTFGAITDGLAHVQILAAGTAQTACFIDNNQSASLAAGLIPYTFYAVVPNPTSGSQTIALQYRGGGANTITIRNPAVEGGTAGFGTLARLLYVITN